LDGACRNRDIIEKTRPTSQESIQPDMARTFFERLWWYDQVVFDASCH
jgi:hypothetical protein